MQWVLSIIKEELDKRRKEIPFIVFVSLFISFAAARTFVLLFPNINLIWRGYHIHHFFLGIFIIILSGGLTLHYHGKHFTRLCAVLYGIGLGIIIDEIGLLITLGNYWERITYDVITYVVLIFLNYLFFFDFWETLERDVIYKRFIKKILNKIKRK
ncbi:MAG: hypothetical protein OH319_02000 [Candidatus Parvarchaeota archaeon]|nr:hypothetical protein [Candidatus Jingweiarchaeum tengchongense]MCW1298143.1 hypothetical protein [Candidatus Jingweiarchaeum tengchongense]MCW1299942.1 hypothetical protein [Candidatus Jingweiarchaeum tengchongense]MCW1305073.1 hypothetical protein [Candidatus Jingweiarchaeum tengchongense]MCW1305564.1 hypothetical protein [Candidatus Jingweiarchaeum tengchongense]